MGIWQSSGWLQSSTVNANIFSLMILGISGGFFLESQCLCAKCRSTTIHPYPNSFHISRFLRSSKRLLFSDMRSKSCITPLFNNQVLSF